MFKGRVGAALLFAALAAVCGSTTAQAAGEPVAGVSTQVVMPQKPDLLRLFDIYVPPKLPELTAVPLLLVLHSYGQDGRNIARVANFNTIADREGLVVTYPYGASVETASPGSWNAGRCCGWSRDHNVNDVEFLNDVVKFVSSIRPIDLRRVYIAGFSNGGMMALRAACDRPDVFAAAVSVSGTLEADCAGSTPVSAMLVNGRDDRTIPYLGTRYSSFLKTSLTSVPAAAETLARRDSCKQSILQQQPRYSTLRYTGCSQNSTVALVSLEHLGHNWPSAAVNGVSATSLAWDFLRSKELTHDG